MQYNGRHPIFNPSQIRSYPLQTRKNKVVWTRLIHPDAVLKEKAGNPHISDVVRPVAEAICRARREGWPVILFSGAHLLKNGFGPLVIDWMQRKVISLLATNSAGTIHDFELALIGETSEAVPNALPRGEFGMAYEFCYINEALVEGNRRRLGYGESLSQMIANPEFRTTVMNSTQREGAPREFAHPEISVLAASDLTGIPVTVHTTVGGDVIDQHPSFDGEAKGGVSGRDFLIFVEHIRRLRTGGVFINMGSAVTGPEVFLKAISMACNVGDSPSKTLVTANFDIRPAQLSVMNDERQYGYYFRDQKSVVIRIPQSFGGRGFYVEGDQVLTLPELFRQTAEVCG
jgi:hypothetical protein